MRPTPNRILLGTLLILGVPVSVSAQLVLNEIHPDPAGSDGGREFVEILNDGPLTSSLAGVSVSFANGATGGPWETRWTGSAGMELAAGERFLVTDRNWMGQATPDVEVYLGLQNGPDAVRLSRDGVVLDMVGYGALTDSLLMEGTPALLVAGSSLARRPDGRDTDDNGVDLVPADPTPGASNFQPFEMTVVAWSADPPSLDRPGPAVTVSLDLSNTGTEAFPGGPVLLRLGTAESTAYFDGLGSGQGLALVFGVTPASGGTFDLEVLLPGGDGSQSHAVVPGRYQVGPGSLVLHEVLSIPGDRQGEWVELLNPGPDPVDLSWYRLADADGNPGGLPAWPLDPGAMVVLAQDSLALTGWIHENGLLGAPSGCAEPAAILGISGWPSLNNTPPESREFSDRILLSDLNGLVIDHLTLGGTSLSSVPAPDGRTLERQSIVPVNPGFSNWLPCGDVTGGTPGCPNSVSVSGAVHGGLEVDPDVLDAATGAVATIRFAVPPGRSGWRGAIYDLGGRRVRNLGGDDLGAGARQLAWDGRREDGAQAGPGGYIVLLEIDGQRFRALVAVR